MSHLTAEPSPSPAAPRIDAIIHRIVRHLEGFRDPLTDVPVAFDVPLFYENVYSAARQIPPGEVCTYGELAKKIGNPHAARAVGQALSKNPIPLLIPCHRVISKNRIGGGFSAFGGHDLKLNLLRREGVHI